MFDEDISYNYNKFYINKEEFIFFQIQNKYLKTKR